MPTFLVAQISMGKCAIGMNEARCLNLRSSGNLVETVALSSKHQLEKTLAIPGGFVYWVIRGYIFLDMSGCRSSDYDGKYTDT